MTSYSVDLIVEAISKGFSGIQADLIKTSKTAETSAQRIASIGKTVGAGMTSIGKGLTAGVTLPLLALGGIAIKAASDIEESMNKMRVVFGENADAIEAWSKTAAESMGMSQQAAVETIGTFGNLFSAMGMTAEQVRDMSMGLVQLGSDLASFNNLDPTVALEKLRAGIVGEVEPLRALGVNLLESTVQAKAMEMGLAAVASELTLQDKVLARYALIMEQTKNSQGDFANTSDGLANSTKILKAKINDLLVVMGTELLPIAKDVVIAISDMAEKFADLDPKTQSLIVKFGLLAVALGPVLTIAGKLVPILASLGGALVGGLAAALGITAAAAGGIVIAVLAAGGAIAYLALREKRTTEQIERNREAMITYYWTMSESEKRAIELSGALEGISWDDAGLKNYTVGVSEADIALNKMMTSVQFTSELVRTQEILLDHLSKEYLDADGNVIKFTGSLADLPGAMAGAAHGIDRLSRNLKALPVSHVQGLATATNNLVDAANRNISSEIENFIDDLKWVAAGGLEIQAAFDQLKNANIPPELKEKLAGELYLAVTEMQLDLDEIDGETAAANIASTLNVTLTEAWNIIKQIKEEGSHFSIVVDLTYNIHGIGLPKLNLAPGGTKTTYEKGQTGGDWMVTSPTLFLAGEGGTPERVMIVPQKHKYENMNQQTLSIGEINVIAQPGSDPEAIARAVEGRLIESMRKAKRDGTLYAGRM